MPRRRSGRFVIEALFLAAVAAAVTLADLRPAGVIVLMALAWLIVALLEWTAWLDEPHYGRGLPPRFYVPQVALPPSRPVEQAAGYPVILEPDEESTFVTAVAEWSAELEEWPVLAASPPDEETQIAPLDPELDYAYEPEPEPRPLPWTDPGPAVAEDEQAEPPAEAPPPVEEVVASAVAGPVTDGAEAPARPERPRTVLQLPPLEPRPATTTVHHVDPLGSSGRRRLFRRAVETAVVEVADGPPPNRRFPGRAARSGEASET